MPSDLSPADRAKKAAAARALREIGDGMTVGLGTGSTAKWLVDLLAARMAEEGIRVTGVPTSSRTREQAEGLGIPLTDLDSAGRLDLTIDGADEFDADLSLIKGGGGALLQEKIVASASERMVVITDPSKRVERLGAFPLPVEVVRFGHAATERAVRGLLETMGLGGAHSGFRDGGSGPYVTDEGHYILDLHLGRIEDPGALDIALNAIPGVVETGLFVGIADMVVIGLESGEAEVVTRG